MRGRRQRQRQRKRRGGLARLDAALSDHFNGIIAPSYQFMLSRRHSVASPLLACVGVDGGARGLSRCLVTAFSLLGNGLVWHKFGGSLALVNSKQTRRGVQAVDECNAHCHTRDEDNNNDGNDDSAFDLLFVPNPLQSWYQKDNNGCFGRYAQ
jgi:hypothetical protein